MFLDELELLVRGGRGGNGVVSFRREKYVPRGGPDGGDGGDGGSVYLWADPGKHSFLDLRYRRLLRAADGGSGRSKERRGASGADLLVPVPPGTVVRNGDKRQVADLTSPGQKVLVAAGGRGGRGNASFASSRRRVPRLAEKGLPGEERKLSLELKLMAQVGLVGLPNAGKSTFLSVVSSARPKVADYPFTTLTPNLGVVKVGDEGSFVMADLPGLIEGAHRGEGLGHRFLRHVERNLVLLFMVDVSPGVFPGPVDAYRLLVKELDAYNPRLSSYRRVIAGNKLDLPGARKNLEKLRQYIEEAGAGGVSLYGISAITGEGVGELTGFLHEMVSLCPEMKDEPAEEVVIRPGEAAGTPLKVEKKGGIFFVSGSAVERVTARTDFENEEALQRFQKYCRRSGLDKELKKMGIREGDAVKIAGIEFNYYD